MLTSHLVLMTANTLMVDGKEEEEKEEEAPLLAEEDLSIQRRIWEVLRICRRRKESDSPSQEA